MLFDPITIAIVAAYFLVRRGGENVMWLARKDGTDPPSYRRWQERQKRRGARGSITGRTEGRKFWAHLWHDAHASAHEWRQRRRGRSWEDRRKRWQAEDVQRQQNQALAPCVFCGAGRGEPCQDTCPEVQAHDANRANSRATVPPQQGAVGPVRATGPSHDTATAPTEPSHPDGTVPPATEPTTPAPSNPSEPNRATEPSPTVPTGALHTSSDNPIGKFTEDLYAAKVEQLQKSRAHLAERRDEMTPAEIRDHEDYCDRLERQVAELRFILGPKRAGNVTPITKNQPTANRRPTDHSTNGGNVTATNVTGEIQGYEATLAEMDQTIAHLEAAHADADRRVAEHEQLDGVYENRINALRQANADEETIGTQVSAREANETQISAAKAALEAASVHLEAEHAARDRWIKGQGAMKETADAVGARGDQVLRD